MNVMIDINWFTAFIDDSNPTDPTLETQVHSERHDLQFLEQRSHSVLRPAVSILSESEEQNSNPSN